MHKMEMAQKQRMFAPHSPMPIVEKVPAKEGRFFFKASSRRLEKN